MANIAIVSHWPLSEMAAMELGELVAWHRRFMDRWESINRPEQ